MGALEVVALGRLTADLIERVPELLLVEVAHHVERDVAGHRPSCALRSAGRTWYRAASDTIEPMRVTFLGQAGVYLETRAGSILCDPWFNPAYFGSWFPFPANDGIDPRVIGTPDYLYVSHLHHDHFDPAWLRDHCSKDATVHPARLSGRRPPPRAPRARLPAVRRNGRLRAVRPGRGAADHGDGARRADGRPAGRLGAAGRRRRDARPEHERRPADRPGQAAGARAARPALPAVLGCDLVPDGLRVPGPRQGDPRPQEAGRPARALPALHRDPGPDVRRAVGRTAMLPRRRPVRAERPAARPGEHLPRPDRVPRPPPRERDRRWPPDAPGLARRAPARDRSR